MSVNTPREKVDDLEDVQVKTRRPLFIKKRITKSVTFDFNKSESKEPDIDEFDSDSKSSDSEDKKDLDDAHWKAQNDILVESKDQPLRWRIYHYCMNSSLFIFHKESKFRKMLISLVVSNEVDADGRPKNLDDNNNESNPDTKPKDGDNVSIDQWLIIRSCQ